MKCGYNGCLHGGNVDKKVADKHNGRYYHKDCLVEKLNKVAMSEIVFDILPNEVKMNVNKCIKTWLDKGYGSEYILYVLNHIKTTKAKLSSVYGVVYYLNNGNILSDYESKKISSKYKDVAKGGFEANKDEVKFTYKSSSPSWLDIMK